MATIAPTRNGYSFSVLNALAGRPTAGEFARRVGRSRRTIERWKAADAIPKDAADTAAIAFGLHPANVWPDQW